MRERSVMLDQAKVDRAEGEIDRFIQSRSASKDKANNQAEAWAASEAKHREKTRKKNREEWIAFYECLAHNHALLAAENRDKADALVKEHANAST